MTKIDLLIHNTSQVVTCAGGGQPKRGAAMRDVGIIENGAVAVAGGKILEAGAADLAKKYSAETVIDAGGCAVLPGFVDPHTHVVYAGDRVDEFELRIQGNTYMEIMAAGGGIMNTVRATRDAGLDLIVEETRTRLDSMLALGTTTIEIKSGYGLDTATEIKMLEAIAELEKTHPATLIPTFMGAHAIPAEYNGRSGDFTNLVIEEMTPAAGRWYQDSIFAGRGLPFFVDVFCEMNAFDLEQSRRVLEAGKAQGMKVKAHVDEFTNLGGLTMALALGATSVDHLDVTPAEEIAILAKSETVGVVIPAVNFNLGSTEFAGARAIIDAGAALALTTDINPGSAPGPSMQFVMALACRYQHLLPAEALNAATMNAACAVGMGDQAGSIEPGKRADLLILDSHDYRHAAYRFGGNLVKTVIKDGHVQN